MHPRNLLLLLLVLCGLATQPVLAQGPTIAPSRLILNTTPSTSYDENKTIIHWTPGDGQGYIVLISSVDINDGAGSVIEPNGSPYLIEGNYRMESASRVPKPSWYPYFAQSKTYLLRTASYSGPADTTAAVLNATMGIKYIVLVYEYIIDSSGNYYYSHTPAAYFTTPAAPPIIKSAIITAPSRVSVTFSTAAESTTRYLRVFWSTDSTDFSNYANSVQVAPMNYPGPYTYEVVAGVLNTFVPVYFKIRMDSGTNFTGQATDFSNTLLATEPKPLPVVLSSFDAKRVAAGAQLDWATASEVNNAGFQLQHSSDGVTWQTIQFIVGAGTTPIGRHYQVTDLSSEAAYYRLAQQDNDGQLHYSPVRYVAGIPSTTLSAYPNPSQGQAVHLIGAESMQPVHLLNTTGQLVRQIIGTTLITSDLTPGVYILRQGPKVSRLVIK